MRTQVAFFSVITIGAKDFVHGVWGPSGCDKVGDSDTCVRGPTPVVNSDVFVNTSRMHTYEPLECSWYDFYQHWWCVRFERSAVLVCVDSSSPVYAMFTRTFVSTNTRGLR
jgi:hypothetical protein